MFDDDIKFFLMGFVLGFLLCLSFFLPSLSEMSEKECFSYYKENGYILETCRDYEYKFKSFKDNENEK